MKSIKLNDLPVGAKVREKTSGVVFLVGEHRHAGYGGTTLVSDHVIGQACLDAPEAKSPSERQRITGNNYYAFSNLHQWLNAEGMSWFRPTHEFDDGPSEDNISKRPNIYDRHGYNAYEGKAGFLSWFGCAFRDALLDSLVPCVNRQQNAIEYIKSKVFLPSAAEAGIRTADPLREGSKIAVFNEFRNRYATPSREAVLNSDWQPAYFNTEQLFWYWLRTPKWGDDGFACYAHPVNPYSYKFSCCPWVGIRPALNIDSDLPVDVSANVCGLWLIG